VNLLDVFQLRGHRAEGNAQDLSGRHEFLGDVEHVRGNDETLMDQHLQ
jgi:hypothetical protein